MRLQSYSASSVGRAYWTLVQLRRLRLILKMIPLAELVPLPGSGAPRGMTGRLQILSAGTQLIGQARMDHERGMTIHCPLARDETTYTEAIAISVRKPQR